MVHKELISTLVHAPGGFIYEEEHVVIVGWGQSQRDIEAIWTILRQVRPPQDLGLPLVHP